MGDLYEKALRIATSAHSGQMDKAGIEYIKHPLYVASLVESEEEKVVALLHDVIEDTDYTPSKLLDEGIPESLVDAVTLLTHNDDEDYFDYLAKVKTNPIAKAVKRADLLHNSDISRIPRPCEKDFVRLEKYKRAIAFIDE